MLLQSRSFSAGLLQYLAKNMALLVQNFWEKKDCQNPFSAILRQKSLSGRTSNGGTFFRLPLQSKISKYV